MPLKARKGTPTRPGPERPIVWPRADPAALDKFDPSSKTCTMNCGKHAHDPRSYKELKFMCDDCDCHAAPNEQKGTPAMNKPRPEVDAEVFLLRLEDSIFKLRQKMMLSAAPDRQVYYGMAQGMLSALRQAELISEADFIRRTDEIAAELGADG